MSKPILARRLLSLISVLIIFSFVFFLRGDSISTESQPTAALPALSATKTASLDTTAGGDLNGNGIVNPGDRLTYTVTINNNGTNPVTDTATNVTINDTIDANTTLVGGSVIASPIAVNDAYSSIGNVGISVPDGASDLLANDLDANNPGSSAALTFVLPVPTVSANGGQVSINTSTGAFTYTPPIGFEGTDTFTYTLSNGTGLTDTATVTINVSGMIWFVDNSQAANGDGRLNSPFSSLANFNSGAADEAGDNIFLYRQTATNYTGGIILLSNQKLIGQGATASLASVTGISVPAFSNALPATGGTRPTLTHSANNVVLSTGNTLRGLNIQSTGGSALFGTSFNNLTALENTVTATGGTAAVNLDQASGTASINAVFISISASNCTNGIILADTTGSFTVNGTGTTDGSGGTIQNTTSNGINLTDTNNVTLKNMVIGDATATAGQAPNGTSFIGVNGINMNNADNTQLNNVKISRTAAHGIDGTRVTNLTISDSEILNAGDGNDEHAMAFNDAVSLNENNLDGAVLITNTVFDGMHEDGIRIENFAGTLNMTVSGSTFANNDITVGENGIQLLADGSAISSLTVNGNTLFDVLSGNSITVMSDGATSRADVKVQQATIQGSINPADRNAIGILLFAGLGPGQTTASRLNFLIDDIDIFDAGASSISIQPNGTSVMHGVVSNNTITGSGSGYGIQVAADDDADGVVSITGNTITQTAFDGIFASNQNTADLDIHIRNNTASPKPGAAVRGGLAAHGIQVNVRETSVNCLDIAGNTSNGEDGGTGYRTRQRDTSIFKLERFTGNGTSITDVQNFLIAQNTSGGASSTVSTSYTGVANGFCRTPTDIPTLSAVRHDIKQNNALLERNLTNYELAETKELHYTPIVGISNSAEISGSGSFNFLTNFISDISEGLVKIADRLDSMISPTVYARKEKEDLANDQLNSISSNSPIKVLSGETVNKNLGTLPPGENIRVQFKVTVDGNIPANDFAVSNTAQISASNHSIINSSTAATTVVQPPTVSKAFGSSFIALNGTTTLTFIITNNNPAQTLSNVSYTDPLPEGLVVAATPNVINNCGAVTISAASRSSSVEVSDLSIPANSSCTIKVDVTGSSEGEKNNTTTAISSLEGGTGLTSNTAVLTVIAAPSFTKAFGAPTVPLNGTTTLTFSITNNSSAISLSNVSFTDNLPMGLIVATPPNVTGSCGDTITANEGSNSISLTGAMLTANAGCMFSVDVTGSIAGVKNNSVMLSTAELGSIPTANASLTVVAPPTISKAFSPTSILVFGTSTLTISITNPSLNTLSLNGVSVSDNFPAGVEVAMPANTINSCATGVFMPISGETSISISGAAIPANTTCHFSVDVIATTLGAKKNTTENVESFEGGAGGTASATLNVGNTVTWTGATSSNWNVATNWSPAQVPSATNNAVIPNGMILHEPIILSIEPDASVSGLTIESERTISINVGRTLTVNGTLSGEGTVNVAGSLSAMTVNSNGEINFNGTAAQAIPTGIYKNLTVNNAAGASLAGDLTINGLLNLTNGVVSSGTHTLTFSDGGAGARGGACNAATCFIAGSAIEGGVRKQFAVGANPGFTFHVGTSGGTEDGYTPVELVNISANAAGDSLTVRAIDESSPATILTPRITRYWDLTETGNLMADLTFTYLDGDDNAIIDLSDLTLYRGAINVCSMDCVDETTFTATTENVTEFSPWTIAQAIPPAPDTMITSNPPNPSNSLSASFTFSSSGMGGTFECDLDGEGFIACASPKGYTSLNGGTHTFQVRAIDGLGQVDPTPASYTWTVDTIPPDTSITANPSDPSGANVSFSFTGTDAGSGMVSFECDLDGGGFAACTSPQSYMSLAQGSHTFMVRAIDGIGNADPTPASFTWTVDTDPPDVMINQAAGQPDPANGMGITIHFTAVFNEPVTGFMSNDVMIGGTAGATTVVVTEISPMNGTTYDVAVSGVTLGGAVTAAIPAGRAQDAAGNLNTASTSTDNTVTYVPNTPPTANPDSYSTTQDTPLSVPAPGVLGNDSETDIGNTITAVLVTGPTNAASFALNADGSFNYTPTAGFAGTDSFTYKAKDNFNAESGVVTVTLNVQYRFDWVAYSGYFGTFNEQGLNQVTAGSNVAVRFTLYGNKGNPYSQPPTSQQISCSTFAPTGAATVINRFAPDPYYSSVFDFYQSTWQTQASWKFTCRRLTLHLNDGTTRSLKFYFK